MARRALRMGLSCGCSVERSAHAHAQKKAWLCAMRYEGLTDKGRARGKRRLPVTPSYIKVR
eukprot:scaffold22596_cov37-Tisochrysis_lutea.AAC.3